MNAVVFPFVIGSRFCLVLSMLLTAGCLLTACEKSDQKPSIAGAVKKYDKATVLEGAVTDNEGPVKAGVIKVSDSNGQIVAGTTLQNSEHYRVEIPANTVLPVVLIFSRGTGQAGAEEFITAVVHPNLTLYDINPLSTAIAKKAQALGGYTHANLVMAAESMGTVPDSNKTTAGFRGDTTKQYGGWH